MSLYSKIIDLQKLTAAWHRVRRNKPAVGVDNITWQQFDENCREELKQLQIELVNHTYTPLPVRNVTLYKGEKARVIALYSMRDKVVQQSLASELTKLFEGRLSARSYAYRNDKSALQAIEDITSEISTGSYNAALKIDISQFFDCIDWNILQQRLSRLIHETDVLELIQENVCTEILDEVSGDLSKKQLGIHQGSAIAPVLSNIYMMDFDIALTRADIFYVRYSDDMLILGRDRQKLLSLMNEISIRLEELHLSVNKDKTICCDMEEGVNFLGYHLDSKGKSIPAKAEDRLNDRLETMWLTNPTLDVEDKAAKALEIVGGWQQYYRGERTIQSIYEYIAFIFAVGGKKEMLERIKEYRTPLENVCRDITQYMTLFWKKNNENVFELLEYEQFYCLPDIHLGNNNVGEAKTSTLLSLYRRYFVYEEETLSTELMQVYTELQEYENARHWMEVTEQLHARKGRFKSISRRTEHSERPLAVIPETDTNARPEKDMGGLSMAMQVTERTSLLMLESFAGRDDIYSIENSVGNQRRRTELQERPLTEQQVADHLGGNNTVGTYIQRPNSTVRFIVWDVDISKQFLLKYGNSGSSFDSCLQHAYHKALDIQGVLENKGMHGYIEFSGFRGYHVWLFLREWIPVRFANMFAERIVEEIVLEDDITIECFPNRVRLKAGRFGQVIKMPYGIHVRSGLRSCFIDEDGQPVTELDNFMETLAQYPLSAIRKALSYALQEREEEEGKNQSETSLNVFSGEQAKKELKETFAEMTPGVQEILFHCSLMQYLCLKAKRTGYLTHFERLSVLYIFGHVGEEGKEFVHDVMRCTMNYQYNVTQRFIERIPEKPVSCLKLREQYKKISAEVGCNCSFKRTKNCYPSPVLHALSLSKDLQEDITLPTSRTMSDEKEKKVIDELNVHKRAQELAVRILELRKQQRALDKAVGKVERDLEKIYDSAGTDALEIEMGMLVRRKKDSAGYEWVIEI